MYSHLVPSIKGIKPNLTVVVDLLLIHETLQNYVYCKKPTLNLGISIETIFNPESKILHKLFKFGTL